MSLEPSLTTEAPGSTPGQSEQINLLAARITALESSVTDINSTLADHEERISDLEGDVESARYIYLSPEGDDANSGEFAAPLLTLAAAQAAIIQLKEDGLHDRPIRVIHREGTYRLTEAVEFTDADSGTEEYPITYEAYTGEEVIITSNELVEGAWATHSGSIKYIDLPGHADFRSLIVDGIPAIRARSPNVGSYYLMEPFSGGEPNESDYFWADPADLPTIGAGETIEVNAFCAWRHNRAFISSIEASGTPRKVNVTGGPQQSGNAGFNFRSDYGRYYLENSLSFLTQAGEFYWNNTTKRLYYWPRDGETLGTTTVEIPTLTTMISATGSDNVVEYPHNYATYSVRFKTAFSSGDATWEKVLVDTLVGAASPNVGVRLSLLKFSGNVGMALIRLGNGVSNYFPVSTAGLNNNAWHTMTCVVNTTANTVTMYVDGVLIGSTSISDAIVLGTIPPTIGSTSAATAGYFWDGEIADVVVLDKEANLADAVALHAQDFDELEDYLLIHFPLTEDFQDATGNLGAVFSELLYTPTEGVAERRAPALTGDSALFNGTTDFISANSALFGEGGLVMNPASHIKFKNLTLTGTDWNLLSGGHWTQEAGYNPLEEPGIKLLRCSHITFENCQITNFGGVGILCDNSEALTVNASEFAQCGNSCIVLNGPPGVISDDMASGHVITNNDIHDFGRVDAGAHGICGIAVGNTLVSHNDIYDGSFQAIRFRGRLDSLNFQGRDNLVTWNWIRNVVRELNDGGGIYFSGRQPGSFISYNLIEDVGVTALHRSGDLEMRGIYLDEGASGITCSFNIVKDCQEPLLLHVVNLCEITNNVFIGCEVGPKYSRYGTANLFGDGTSTVYAKNNSIHANVFGETTDGRSAWLYWESSGYNATIGGIAGELDYNAYEVDAFTERLAGVSTQRNIAYLRSNYSIEQNSVAGSDLLILSDNMPRNDSPAYGIGFVRFDLSEVGAQE